MLLLAGTRTAVAQTGTIYVPFEDVGYSVDRYDENGDVRYEVIFTDFGFESNYDFDGNGFVTRLEADNERYRFLYRANGRLRLVRLLSSRRMLGEEAIEVADVAGGGDKALVGERSLFGAMGVEEQTTPAVDGGGGRRRLLECDECRQTWDTVCDNGVATVCDLVEYGDPFLGAGDVSVGVFCENFGQLCDENTSDDVCSEECGGGGDDEECLAPLTILLEYEYIGEGDGDSEGYSLDLYVIEPGGTVAYWDNSVTVRPLRKVSAAEQIECRNTYLSLLPSNFSLPKQASVVLIEIIYPTSGGVKIQTRVWIHCTYQGIWPTMSPASCASGILQ